MKPGGNRSNNALVVLSYPNLSLLLYNKREKNCGSIPGTGRRVVSSTKLSEQLCDPHHLLLNGPLRRIPWAKMAGASC
jgi:hypothetical protein